MAFVLVLSWSRQIFLRFYLNARSDAFLHGHAAAFETWGGVPRVLLYDNLRSAVLGRRGNTIEFNPSLLALAAHYRFEPRPVALARGNEKVTVRSCRYFGPEVAAARRSVRPVPDRACGSASVRANRVAMRFQCPTPFLTLAITPLRSASIAIWQALRTAPYQHDRTVT